jgi:putative endonuclease
LAGQDGLVRPAAGGMYHKFMSFVVYILYSKSLNKYYVGSTNNLISRLNQHNKGKSISTKSGLSWNLVYSEEYNTRTDATRREKQIKTYHSG